MALRTDIITRVRDYLYEVSTVPIAVKLWTDTQLQRLLTEEMNSLPRKGVYLEEVWATDLEVNKLDYSLPPNTIKAEKVEVNVGSSSVPDWKELKGYDFYAGALYLASTPTIAYPMQVYIRKGFTPLTDDLTATDVPDPELEVVVAGTAKRALKMVLAYFANAKNWDTVAKPDGVSLNQINSMYATIKGEYEDILKTYRKYPRPRDIDLVN